jgi:5-methylthioribose kinase
MIKLTKDISQIAEYLTSKKWIKEGEEVTKIEVPGEGNMNFTLRVVTNKRSFIVKQSRDYVEKYPQVAAPADRSQREAEFYEAISSNSSLNHMTPNLIGQDPINNIIIMEDLGAGADFSYLYKAEETIGDEDLKEIMDFAATLHLENKAENAAKLITNRSMRKLNHEHMFIYPYMEENGLDLDAILPGLKEVALPYKNDKELLGKVKDLGDRYLTDGDTLLHGDYFPGSWLKTSDGIKIIDPEFCFYGYPEFEIGVTVAHLMMSDLPVETIFNAFKYYNSRAALDMELCKQCVGVEIMRRIMGLAQLPLAIDLEKRAQLLETAREYLLN